MTLAWRSIAFALTAAMFLAACTTPDRVTRLYRDAQFAGSFSSLLVVGVHDDVGARRRYESAVVSSLNDAGTEATSSIALLGSTAELSRETVIAAANRSGSEGVLVTRLVDVSATAEIQQGRSSFSAQRRNSIPMADFFRYEYAEYQDPMTITTVHTVILATDLYDLASESKVWGVESTSLDKATVDATIDGASRAIARALSNDGLLAN